jgi:hypothetical protein
MTDKKTLKLALEALEGIHPGNMTPMAEEYWNKAINAIKQALAAQQEPFEYWNAVEGWVKIDEVREHFDSVGCGTIYKTAGEGRVPLTATQRQWVGLTDEQISAIGSKIFPSTWNPRHVEFARAIEAAHGIKENT